MVSMQLSVADAWRLAELKKMKTIALAALIVSTIIFLVSFALERSYPWLAYLRAFGEGGMVGALADWFAVTALFRRPLGLPIPHTAIIPNGKNQLGESLAEFVETNFLTKEVLRTKLGEQSLAFPIGNWLQNPENAQRVAQGVCAGGQRVLDSLSDADVQTVISDIARANIVDTEWCPALGRQLARIVENDGHRDLVETGIESLSEYLDTHPDSFAGFVKKSWMPGFVKRSLDDRLFKEARAFVAEMRANPGHPARRALDNYLAELSVKMQVDPETIAKFETAKANLFDSPRLRDLSSNAWDSIKNNLSASLADPNSVLYQHLVNGIGQAGLTLVTDPVWQARVDRLTDYALDLVEEHKSQITSIISDTIARWDAQEASDKIELMVGKDLQFIRLNGTIIGSLAGVAIFAIARALFGG